MEKIIHLIQQFNAQEGKRNKVIDAIDIEMKDFRDKVLSDCRKIKEEIVLIKVMMQRWH